MARQWKEQEGADRAKPGFVWTYAHYRDSTLIFHTRHLPDSDLLGSASCQCLGFARLFFTVTHKATAGTLKIRLLRGHNYVCQYAINRRLLSTVKLCK